MTLEVVGNPPMLGARATGIVDANCSLDVGVTRDLNFEGMILSGSNGAISVQYEMVTLDPSIGMASARVKLAKTTVWPRLGEPMVIYKFGTHSIELTLTPYVEKAKG